MLSSSNNTQRWIWVQLLMPGGQTKWVAIRWGKQYLDEIRKQGVIINSHE